jgi:hypothetical protein
MNRDDDREILKNARPFIRSVAAFLLYLRFGGPATANHQCNYNIGEAHVEADHFLDRLDKDLGK